ncbi:MAG: four helix bundle protein [Acidobacteria bacterium]|jgi:four helix bundle protein|nr:four helix bundle protein [Acidobacteriota bacterium]
MNEETKVTFENLVAWRESRDLRMEITLLVKEFPDEEKYRLVDQMIRAARAISGNIAEGQGRVHFQENIQFCRRARGALSELLDHLYVALDDKYITEDEFNYFRNKCINVEQTVNDHIAELNKQKQAHVNPPRTTPVQNQKSTHPQQSYKSPGGKHNGVKRI